MMIRNIRLTGLVFAAVLTLGAVSVTSASAAPLIKFTKAGAFSGESEGTPILEASGGQELECAGTAMSGEVLTEDHGEITISLTGCSFRRASCTGTGESKGSAEGDIGVLALLLLGSDTAPAEDKPAVLILPDNKAHTAPASITFSCGLLGEFTIKGSIIGLVVNSEKEGKLGILIKLEKGTKAGEQKDKLFWDESETGIENAFSISAEGLEKFSELEFSVQAQWHLSGSEIQVEVK